MVGLENEGHPAAFHLKVAFDLGDQEQFVLDLLHDVPAEFEVGHFATLELEGELDLVALFEEVSGVINLDDEVMLTDPYGLELELLKLTAAGGRARLILFFLLLVPPLAVIHDAAYGRLGGGRDFDEVEAGFTRPAQRICGADTADLFFILVDQKNRRNADLLVVAEIGGNSRTRCIETNLEACAGETPNGAGRSSVDTGQRVRCVPGMTS